MSRTVAPTEISVASPDRGDRAAFDANRVDAVEVAVAQRRPRCADAHTPAPIPTCEHPSRDLRHGSLRRGRNDRRRRDGGSTQRQGGGHHRRRERHGSRDRREIRRRRRPRRHRRRAATTKARRSLRSSAARPRTSTPTCAAKRDVKAMIDYRGETLRPARRACSTTRASAASPGEIHETDMGEPYRRTIDAMLTGADPRHEVRGADHARTALRRDHFDRERRRHQGGLRSARVHRRQIRGDQPDAFGRAGTRSVQCPRQRNLSRRHRDADLRRPTRAEARRQHRLRRRRETVPRKNAADSARRRTQPISRTRRVFSPATRRRSSRDTRWSSTAR